MLHLCPSTTTAALPVYYSGKVPYETGWIGWSQYFKEYGRSLDMFSHKESYLGDYLKNPIKNLFEEELNYESIFYQIEKASPNVRAFEVQPQYAEQRAKRSVRANNLDEIETAIYDICSMPGKNFIVAYSDNPDGLLHKYGTDSQETKDFIKNAEKRIQEIRANLDEDTLIIISADHGHKNIEKAYSIIDYPEIMECLIIPPTLESRALSFWVKDEMKDEFVKRFNKEFEKEFWLMSKDEFLNKYKMLGTGKKHKKIDDFILEENRKGKNVYILDATAALYMIPIDKYNKNYDMFLKGNLGADGEEGQIENLKKENDNTVVLIMNNSYSRNWQTPEKVRKYIIDNWTKRGEIEKFDIYEKEK